MHRPNNRKRWYRFAAEWPADVKVTVVSRQTLALRAPNVAHLTRRTPAEVGVTHEGITWHHTGSGGNLYRPNASERLRGIQAFHMDSLGYGDIAYHAAFDADAHVYVLRDVARVGAHAKSTQNRANRLTDGVCFLEDSRGITAGALAAFEWFVALYRAVHHRRPVLWAHEAWAHGHGGTPTACPGEDWVRVLRFVHGEV